MEGAPLHLILKLSELRGAEIGIKFEAPYRTIRYDHKLIFDNKLYLMVTSPVSLAIRENEPNSAGSIRIAASVIVWSGRGGAVGWHPFRGHRATSHRFRRCATNAATGLSPAVPPRVPASREISLRGWRIGHIVPTSHRSYLHPLLQSLWRWKGSASSAVRSPSKANPASSGSRPDRPVTSGRRRSSKPWSPSVIGAGAASRNRRIVCVRRHLQPRRGPEFRGLAEQLSFHFQCFCAYSGPACDQAHSEPPLQNNMAPPDGPATFTPARAEIS